MQHQMKYTKYQVEVSKAPTMDTFIADKVKGCSARQEDDAFVVGDLGDIVAKFNLWKKEMPRVEPFYAVKCNDDPAIISVLAQLGTGFDCASKGEISQVLNMDVPPNRIVYANPYKQTSYLRYAANNNVALMTFDGADELHKVKETYPNARLLVRIQPPEFEAEHPLGVKFGTPCYTVPSLLETAKELDLNVVGVSFHVGSGIYDTSAFPTTLRLAHSVFEMGKKAGYHFDVLDIGGGWHGKKNIHYPEPTFEETCKPLREALDEYFPQSMGLQIIAEPGTFFVASAFAEVVNIIAKRPKEPQIQPDEIMQSGDRPPEFMYYLNDGVYGNLNYIINDPTRVHIEPELLDAQSYKGKPKYQSTIWGPTCDGADCIREEIILPELKRGDWLVFRDFGAYTMAVACDFNGMARPKCSYFMNEDSWLQLSSVDDPRENLYPHESDHAHM